MNINNKARILLLGVAFLAAVPVSHGQILKRIKKKAEKAAEKAIDDVVSGDEEANQTPEEAPSTGLPAKAAVSQVVDFTAGDSILRSEEHTSELQSLMRISYAV